MSEEDTEHLKPMIKARVKSKQIEELQARVKELEAKRDILYKGVFYYAVNSDASSDVADRTLDAYDKLKKGEG